MVSTLPVEHVKDVKMSIALNVLWIIKNVLHVGQDMELVINIVCPVQIYIVSIVQRITFNALHVLMVLDLMLPKDVSLVVNQLVRNVQ